MLYTKATSGARHKSQVCSDRQPDAANQAELEKNSYAVKSVLTNSNLFLLKITFESWKTAHYLSFSSRGKSPSYHCRLKRALGAPACMCITKKTPDIKLMSEEARLEGNSLDTISKLEFHSPKFKGG